MHKYMNLIKCKEISKTQGVYVMIVVMMCMFSCV